MANKDNIAMISSVDLKVEYFEIIASINVETVSSQLMHQMAGLIAQNLSNYGLSRHLAVNTIR
jgi:hypothetical protein